jgi:hypothetical protein
MWSQCLLHIMLWKFHVKISPRSRRCYVAKIRLRHVMSSHSKYFSQIVYIYQKLVKSISTGIPWRTNCDEVELTGQALNLQHNTEARSRSLSCRGKAISITYSECVSVTSVTQHAKRMRRIILSSVACPAVHIFPHYPINCTIFGKKLLNMKCVFWFSL